MSVAGRHPHARSAHESLLGRVGEGRDPDYFARDRAPFLDWLGGTHQRVLEIGCGAGENAGWLRRHGALEIVGIEIDEESAAVAATRFDRVHAESVESVLPRLDDTYDLVLCLDILEHLVDPWSVLEALRDRVAPGGRLGLSIPNIRFFLALWSIAVGRGFQYEPEGIFDVTHLRFYTKDDARRLLESTGWRAVRWGTPGRRLRWLRWLLRRLTFGWSDQYISVQWFVTAEPAAPSRGSARQE